MISDLRRKLAKLEYQFYLGIWQHSNKMQRRHSNKYFCFTKCPNSIRQITPLEHPGGCLTKRNKLMGKLSTDYIVNAQISHTKHDRYRILLAEEIHCFLILKAKCFDFVSGNLTLHQFMTPRVCAVQQQNQLSFVHSP